MSQSHRANVLPGKRINGAVRLAAVSAIPARFETLEQRQHLSTTLNGDKLVIEGSSLNDTVTLTLGGNGATIDVQENGSLAQFPTSTVKSIQISTGDGNDTITLSNQVITFTRPVFKQIKLPAALIQGGSGDDTIQGGPSADTIFGDNQPLVILPAERGGIGGRGASSELRLIDFGGTGNDQINGGAGNDTIRAGNGADRLDGGAGNDALFGEGGPDLVTCGPISDGADVLSGGPQGPGTSDTLDYSQRTVGVMIAAGGGNISGQPGENDTVLADFESTFGGKGNDTIIGRSDAFEQLHGNDGDDRLVGNGNTDRLSGGRGNDTLEGGDGDDQLDGGEGNNVLSGGDGDDDLIARAGTDIFNGGAGLDAVRYDFRSENMELFLDGTARSGAPGENDRIGTDVEVLNGSRGSDLIVGNDQDNRLNSMGGRDTIHAGAGNDVVRLFLDGAVVFGEAGDDFIDGNEGGDTIDGGAGNDFIRAEDGDDQIDGGAGDDRIEAGLGADVIRGGAGNDRIDGGLGADDMSGGDGQDVAQHVRSENLRLSLNDVADDGATGEGDNIRSDFEAVEGGRGNDTIIGSSAPNRLSGNGGNDQIDGRGGNDTILGGTGNDALKGGPGNDALDGQDGDDRLDGGAGNDVLNGGLGTDTANYSDRTDKLTLRIDGQAHSGAAGEKDTINLDLEIVRSGSGNDLIVGSNNAETIFGGAGNDTIRGMGGNDRLDGGDGSDSLIGGDGNDQLFGRAGFDKLFGQNGNDTLFADDLIKDHLDGGGGRDRFRGDDVDVRVSVEARI